MQQVPPPSEEQVERVRDAIGASGLRLSARLEGGLDCAMDVLADGDSRFVLRRYGPRYAERGEDAAARETRALELLQKANVPAPAPIWVDCEAVFDEQAIVISHMAGEPDLTPANPFDWAEQLARALAKIHAVRLGDDDLAVFPAGAGEDERKVLEAPEMVLEHPLGEALLRRRLQLDIERAPSEDVFSHTDYSPTNTLWRDGALDAVVDWESPATGEREMDVAYCSLDIRFLGMGKVADRFVQSYREVVGESLPGLSYWESVGLCRPMPDIARWVPCWVSMGRNVTEDEARRRYTTVLEEFLARTG